MKIVKYRFDSPIDNQTDKALNRIEPWFRQFCRRKRLRFQKNYHNSPARDALAVGRDGITRKLQLSPYFSEDSQFQGYLVAVMASRDKFQRGGESNKPRRRRESWWSIIRKMKRLPTTEGALTDLLEDAWSKVRKVKAVDLKLGPDVQ